MSNMLDRDVWRRIASEDGQSLEFFTLCMRPSCEVVYVAITRHLAKIAIAVSGIRYRRKLPGYLSHVCSQTLYDSKLIRAYLREQSPRHSEVLIENPSAQQQAYHKWRLCGQFLDRTQLHPPYNLPQYDLDCAD